MKKKKQPEQREETMVMMALATRLAPGVEEYCIMSLVPKRDGRVDPVDVWRTAVFVSPEEEMYESTVRAYEEAEDMPGSHGWRAIAEFTKKEIMGFDGPK